MDTWQFVMTWFGAFSPWLVQLRSTSVVRLWRTVIGR